MSESESGEWKKGQDRKKKWRASGREWVRMNGWMNKQGRDRREEREGEREGRKGFGEADRTGMRRDGEEKPDVSKKQWMRKGNEE